MTAGSHIHELYHASKIILMRAFCPPDACNATLVHILSIMSWPIPLMLKSESLPYFMNKSILQEAVVASCSAEVPCICDNIST